MESLHQQSFQHHIPDCPVLRPTMKEFQNFQEYVNMIEREYSKKYGIVKVIPPKKWKPHNLSHQDILNRVKIPGPIEQNTYGKGGIYELLYIQKKSLTLAEYERKAQPFNHITEGKQVEEVEREFWKNINFSPPLYGADFMQSLFESGVPWNLAELKTFLSDGLPEKISGVTYPYLYVGCWKSMFGWHKEDLDLNAINFLHFGKTKLWYCIAAEEAHKLEQFARQHFSDSFSKCPEYLRHKTVMISPYVLKQRYRGNITIHKACQEANEFIITTSGAYHCGFNWGYNLAEAVNFGTLGWLARYFYAGVCKCVRDSVRIDKQTFLDYLQKTKYRNEPEVLAFRRAIEQDEEKQREKERQKQMRRQTGSNAGSHNTSLAVSPVKSHSRRGGGEAASASPRTTNSIVNGLTHLTNSPGDSAGATTAAHHANGSDSAPKRALKKGPGRGRKKKVVQQASTSDGRGAKGKVSAPIPPKKAIAKRGAKPATTHARINSKRPIKRPARYSNGTVSDAGEDADAQQ